MSDNISEIYEQFQRQSQVCLEGICGAFTHYGEAIRLGLCNLKLTVRYREALFGDDVDAAGAYISTTIDDVAVLASHEAELLEHAGFFANPQANDDPRIEAARVLLIEQHADLSGLNQILINLADDPQIAEAFLQSVPEEKYPRAKAFENHDAYVKARAEIDGFMLRQFAAVTELYRPALILNAAKPGFMAAVDRTVGVHAEFLSRNKLDFIKRTSALQAVNPFSGPSPIPR